MKRLLWLAPVLFFLIACDKDKFQTKPQITLKSITTFVPLQGIFEATFSFTDKEGDLGNGQLVYRGVLLNKRPLAPGIDPYDSVAVAIPTFPDKSNGDIKLNLQHTFLYKDIQRQGGADVNDTIRFRIYVRDKAGNVSDTLDTESVVIQGN